MRKKHGETDLQAADRYMKERRAAAGLFPALCRVFRAFDGKIYNVRLERAIQAEIGRIYTETRNNYISVWYFSESGEHMTLASLPVPADKRIHAADFIQAAEDKRNEYLKEAAHMAEIIPTIETRRQQIEILKKQLDGVLADLSYTEKEIFDLQLYVRKY